MMKILRRTDALVVILSTLMMGCAKQLPELPIDIKPAPASAAKLTSNGVITYEEMESSNVRNFPLDLIANDLVKALSLVPQINPRFTSVHAPTSASEFDKLIKDSMLQQGYSFEGRRFGSNNQQLSTSFMETETEFEHSELTAIMALNSVLIKRTYLIQKNTVEPKGSYSIRGANQALAASTGQIRSL